MKPGDTALQGLTDDKMNANTDLMYRTQPALWITGAAAAVPSMVCCRDLTHAVVFDGLRDRARRYRYREKHSNYFGKFICARTGTNVSLKTQVHINLLPATTSPLLV